MHQSRPLKILVLFVCSFVLLAGCQTGPFARPRPEERFFDAHPDRVFAEARALLEESGYRIEKVRPAAGELEGWSPVQTDSPFGEAVQKRVQISVTSESPAGSRVTVLGTILEEGAMPAHGVATFQEPFPTILYDIFFEDLGERLADSGEASSGEQP